MWPALVVIAAVLLTYGNSLANGFVWDDREIVVENPLNREWSHAATVARSPDVVTEGQNTPYYRPLSRLSYLLDYQLFGLQPWGYHLVSVVLHLVAALSLLALARRLIGPGSPALLAALLLACHPVHSEAVNFVATRNTVLSAALFVGAFVLYLRGRDERRLSSYALSAALFLAGLLSKETGVMLLPLLVLFELAWRRVPDRRPAEPFVVLGGFTGLTIAYLAVRAQVLGSVIGGSVSLRDVGQAAVNILHSIPKYLQVVLYPVSLTPLYSYPENYLPDATSLILAWVVIVAVLGALLWRPRRATVLGILWFGVTFLPVSTIVPIPSAPMAERYLYLPVIGLWLVAADRLAGLRVRSPVRRTVVTVAFAVVAVLAAVTARRNLDWRDNLTLFSAAVQAEPDSPFAHYNLGVARMEAGDDAGARASWESAVELDPRYADAWFQLGSHLAERGMMGPAERCFETALSLNPSDALAHYNLAMVMERTARPSDAIFHYRRFLELASVDYRDTLPVVRDRIEQILRDLHAGAARGP